MRIACIGGGPGGLYLALLMKRADPRHDVVVVERNGRGDTFGFGVVFSDATMAGIAAADSEAFDAIGKHLVRWDDIAVHYGGEDDTVHRTRVQRHEPAHAARRSPGAGRGGGCDARVRTVDWQPRRIRTLRPRRWGRRRQQHRAPAARRRRCPRRCAAESLRLARHEQAVRRVHVLLPQRRTRPVAGARLSIRARSLDVHRRVPRRDVAGGGAG